MWYRKGKTRKDSMESIFSQPNHESQDINCMYNFIKINS